MKLPRDLRGPQLAGALRSLGYSVTRQSGSHIRITTQLDGEHHEVVPNYSPIKVGTLQAILRSVAVHHGLTVAQVLEKLEI